MDKIVGPSSRHAKEDRIVDIFPVSTADIDDKIIEAARRLWSNNFGLSRVARNQRVDAGIKRPGPDKDSEIAFLRKRRQAAIDPKSTPDIRGDARACWGEGHMKEEDFQAKKRLKRAHFMNDHLLPSERQRLFSEADHDNWKKDQWQKARMHKRAQERREATLSLKRPLPRWEPFSKVFLESRLSPLQSSSVAQILPKLKMHIGKNSAEANFFAVADLANIGDRVSWTLAFLGGTVATEKYFKTNGQAGGCASYHLTSGTLWVSASFAAENYAVYELVETLIARSAGRWTWQPGAADDFVRSRRTRLFGLIAKREKASDAFREKCNVFSARALRDHIIKLDASSVLG
mmetsp:Transcript_26777/g.58221  ORF Transcript_26777/g.58221 Transcript_26777/m.58221 type:complete len:347 (+) Transcript_26777:637-1677(+)